MIEQLVARVFSTRDCAHLTFGAAFFIGREHAQAEERYIEANGGRRYHTPVAPEWAVFNLKWWDRDALLDWILPTLVVVSVALLSMHW